MVLEVLLRIKLCRVHAFADWLWQDLRLPHPCYHQGSGEQAATRSLQVSC